MIRFLRLIARLIICIPMIIKLPFELANIFIEEIINILDFSIDKRGMRLWMLNVM